MMHGNDNLLVFYYATWSDIIVAVCQQLWDGAKSIWILTFHNVLNRHDPQEG